jgi:hypothetical protein
LKVIIIQIKKSLMVIIFISVIPLVVCFCGGDVNVITSLEYNIVESGNVPSGYCSELAKVT